MRNQPTRPRSLLTLIFYALSIPLVWVLCCISPSGPCTPGLGVLGLFALFLLSIILFIINLGITVFGKGQNGTPALIHLLVAIGCFVIFF